MDSEYIYALIGIGGTLLGTLVGALITFLYDRIKESDRVKSEIRSAINEVAFIQVTNDYPVALNKLRAAIVKNAHVLVDDDALTTFFSKWLNQPVVHYNRPIVNFMDSARIEEMLNDLGKIKL